MPKKFLLTEIKDFNFDPELENYKEDLLNEEFLNSRILLPTQCCYIFDVETTSSPYWDDNFEKIFGWVPNPIENLYLNVHPEDKEHVEKKTISAFNYVSREGFNKPFENVSSLEYRLRKSDGDYLNILRQQCVYSIDSNGLIIHTLGIFTVMLHKENDDFNNQIIIKENSALTERELEILKYFSEGMKVPEVSKALNISIHTVKQHSKNIKIKLKVSNVNQMLKVARQNHLIK